MIEFTKGDMFARQVDARVNTVNCVGVMGAGVALAFKKRYPDMFRDYQQACKEGRVAPGNLHIWKGKNNEWVINFPTKRNWQDPSRYEDISSGLRALREYLHEQGAISVALPALGCGHGGLDWSRVSLMIQEALSGLDAHVFVFEPADSRNAGYLVKDQPTEDEIRELEDLGFRQALYSQWLDKAELPPAILSKGDPSLLDRRWIALLPSKDPSERELEALSAVARQMALSSEAISIALVHATRATERIAKVFLDHHIAVILILPFGPLTRKAIARTPVDKEETPFLIASVAEPKGPWSRTTLARSMKMLQQGASSLLLSDPTPYWVNEKVAEHWVELPVFYLRYGKLSDPLRHVLEHAGAHPIGRRQDTGEPNLAPLFGDPSERKIEPRRASPESQDDLKLPLTPAAASKLRELADLIEQATYTEEVVLSIIFPQHSPNDHLSEELRRILTSDIPTKRDPASHRNSRAKKRTHTSAKNQTWSGALFDKEP